MIKDYLILLDFQLILKISSSPPLNQHSLRKQNVYYASDEMVVEQREVYCLCWKTQDSAKSTSLSHDPSIMIAIFK